MRRPRLLIVDDHEAIRYMFKLFARADCEVVGEAEDGREAIDLAEQLRPDLLVIDVSMPGMSGLEVVRLLKESMPDLAIIVASQHDDHAYVEAAFKAGVKGYVLKQSAALELPQAIRDVIAGRSFCSSLVRGASQATTL